MNILISKRFEKMFRGCPKKITGKFMEKLELFKSDKYNSVLNNHSLSGKLKGFRSINITEDWRAIFEEDMNGNYINFIAIGTHSELYE